MANVIELHTYQSLFYLKATTRNAMQPVELIL